MYVGKRTIGVVGAGDNDAWKGEVPLWQRCKTDCLGGEAGAFRVGDGNKQSGLDRRMRLGGPMGNGEAGQAMCRHYH